MSLTHIAGQKAPTPNEPELPANVGLEQTLLGALLTNNDVLHVACGTLGPEHFTEEVHRRIYDVAVSMIREGRPANPVTMAGYFGSTELGPGLTVARYLARLAADAVTIVEAPSYAAELIALHGRRQLITAAEQTRRLAYDPHASLSVEQMLDDAEARLAALRAAAPAQAVTRGHAAAFATELLDEVEASRAAEHHDGVSATTGIPDLDRDTGGLEPGLLWIVAGRPGMGKTIVATNLARAAANAGHGTLLFSLEVPRKQLTARLLSDLSFSPHRPIPFGDILRGRFGDADQARLRRTAERLEAMPLVVDCASRLTVSQIASRVRAERLRMAKTGIRLGAVVIDYLKFVSATDRYAGQRHYEVGEISGALKALAKDQDVCVVLLAQLNRQVEGRQDRRPDLADLRESGDLEADADVVAFVYRDAYYIERSPEYRRSDAAAVDRAIEAQNKLEIIVGKNRAGQTRSHHLWVNVACSTMSARSREGA